LAKKLGIKDDGLNVDNALKSVSRAIDQYVECGELVLQNGYSSLAFALKALGQKKLQKQFPDWCSVYPDHWLQEMELRKEEAWANGRSVARLYKVPEVTHWRTQKNLDSLKPVLLRVFNELDWNPIQLEEVRKAYNSKSYHDFQHKLYDFLRPQDRDYALNSGYEQPCEDDSFVEPHDVVSDSM
jgi:hypothetical protein